MRLFNHDRQAQVVDQALRAIAYGESHEFTREQIAGGLAPTWKPDPPADVDAGDPADLDSLTRTDLNRVAADEGVEHPDRLRNRAEVIEAINAARAASTEDADEGEPDTTTHQQASELSDAADRKD